MSDEAREHQNRIEALANAVRHRLKDEMTAEEIVQSAQKYFEFLQGTQEAQPQGTQKAQPADEPVIPQPRPVRTDNPPGRTFIK